MSNQVALGGLAIAGHHDPIGIPQCENCGSFRRLNRPGISREIHRARISERRQQIGETRTWGRDVEQQRKTRSRAHSPPFWM